MRAHGALPDGVCPGEGAARGAATATKAAPGARVGLLGRAGPTSPRAWGGPTCESYGGPHSPACNKSATGGLRAITSCGSSRDAVAYARVSYLYLAIVGPVPEHARVVGWMLVPLGRSEKTVLRVLLWRMEKALGPLSRWMKVLLLDRGYWGAGTSRPW